MKQNILASIQDGIQAIEFLELSSSVQFIEESAKALCDCFRRGGKVLLAGNGGSLCDAMHFGEELTGFYRILVVMTTSGNSENLINAVSAAKERGLYTIAFLGKSGGKLRGQCDLELVVNGFVYSDRIQEAHMTAIHILIEQIEKALFFDENILKEKEFCCHER